MLGRRGGRRTCVNGRKGQMDQRKHRNQDHCEPMARGECKVPQSGLPRNMSSGITTIVNQILRHTCRHARQARPNILEEPTHPSTW